MTEPSRIFVSAQCQRCRKWFLVVQESVDGTCAPVGCSKNHARAIRRRRRAEEMAAGQRDCIGCGRITADILCQFCMRSIQGCCYGKRPISSGSRARLIALGQTANDYLCPVCREFHTGRVKFADRVAGARTVVERIERRGGRSLLDKLVAEWRAANAVRTPMKTAGVPS